MNDALDLKVIGANACGIAHNRIASRYENSEGRHRLYHHNVRHTEEVIDRALQIGNAFGLTQRELLLTTVAAAFHDIVQKWTAVEKDNGIVVRQRQAGLNEIASAHEAVIVMNQLGFPFTPQEKGIVTSAIIGTIPEWSDEYGTVIQPLLTSTSHPIIRAVAFADLNSAGMDTASFQKDGPSLFAEENIDVMEALAESSRSSDIDIARQQRYRDRYLTWLKTQPGFVCGRQRYFFEHDLAGLGIEVKDRLANLFDGFYQSINAATLAVMQAESLDFVSLMRQLQPTAFPSEGR